MGVKGREEILEALGELVKFTFSDFANKKLLSIFTLYITKETSNKILANSLINSIVHDEPLSRYILHTFNFKNYFKAQSDKIIFVGEKIPIGYLCFKYMTFRDETQLSNINLLNKTEYRKKLKRIKMILNSLKNYDNKNR